ncbi:ankyrin repeat domain-containing protein [Fictibacillus sp. NPDC058756]|uniref:ankyrin repeat domain-containing protein n=1 Tax=Fictibacillus sp. NPDC058756 TaxID=3346625 RepID=UPI0036C792F1
MSTKKGKKIKKIKKDVYETKNVHFKFLIFTDIKHVNGVIIDADRARVNGIKQLFKDFAYEEVMAILPMNKNFLQETVVRSKRYIQVLQNVSRKNICTSGMEKVRKDTEDSHKIVIPIKPVVSEENPVQLLKEIWEKSYKEGYLDALSIIYKSNKVSEKCQRKALFYAAKTGDFLLIDTLLNLGISIHTQDLKGNTALFMAVKHGKFNMMLYLLRAGAKLEHVNLNNENVIIQGIKSCRKIEIIRYLLDRGLDVNHIDQDGMNALMCAITSSEAQKSNEWMNIVRSLIDAKIDLNHKDQLGKTALMHACSHYNENNSEELIKLLIERGADPAIKDLDGRTARSYARDLNHSKMMYLLQQNSPLTIPFLDVQESNMATASKVNYEKDSFLSRNGYNTMKSSAERWRILNKKVFPNHSKQSTINFMATMIKRYKRQRGGAKKYENAIRTYEMDIERILKE